MASGWKFIKNIKMLRTGAKLLSAAVVTSAATGMSKSKKIMDGKDEIFFLSKEENSVPSTAKIVMQETEENRDPVLPNGDLNWACTCIEKDVVGPCNLEFRKLREYMHINLNNEIADFETFDEDTRKQFDRLFESYILCTMNYPVYYEDSMLDEEKEQLKKSEEREKALEEKKRKEKEANCRHFGIKLTEDLGKFSKDEVVFLTKEENSTPSTVFVPQVQVEENRDPVLPNGEINWACTCIEKDVVGPCNIEFREFRKFVAENRNKIDEDDEISEAGKVTITNFLGCIRKHPVYYKSVFSKDSDDDNGDDNDEFDKKAESKT